MSELTGTGVWSSALRYGDRARSAEAAAELEELGYTAAWIPDVGGNLFGAVERLLAATPGLVVATGILNLWLHAAAETAERHRALTQEYGERLVFGIGVSHAPLIDAVTESGYTRPLATVRAYLDAIDAEPVPVPRSARLLAALGPKMLELARDRTAGSHPYLVTPEHTAVAREALGADAVLAPEQAVVLSTDPAHARRIARVHLSGYLLLPNYSNNWMRLGFTPDDLLDGGSDRLVDALVAWGDEDAIASRVDEHRAAGADHVCIQVLSDDGLEVTIDEWRRLAPALVG